ncbi:nonribosomal peptide synthetase 1 [Aspergillus udagawae]|uniref:Nonribosomal peptide synthetase 1 n=1 Tax=Aspergillus udagawae TaxID=91492 RepID=A0ABQ1BFF2_9EURO|nr:nonribosomal peptide synthetase 1 [Aspergillus udagawae]
MARARGYRASSMFQESLDWNQKVPPAADTHVHCLIEAQATQHPELQAVCSWDGSLTYDELDKYSSQLASHLSVFHGVGPDVIVPLCFEKSVWTIVGLFAVLKAGGAFLLLDVSQPAGRLETIVRQTGATVGLSSTKCVNISEALVEETVVCDGNTLSALTKEHVHKAKTECSCEDLSNPAYLIFTSGSTGTPKGVVIEHSQLATTSTVTGRLLGYGHRSRVFQFASYAFDACITDIFATLAHGGTICIPSEWDRNNAIVESMNRMRVNNAKFTPSLAGTIAIETVPTLRTLVLGGEACPISFVEKWSAILQLILVYGPAECCVICFTTDASQRKTVPAEIGRPVGSRAWIVRQDDSNELADVGEVGELFIEGPLVGRGYLNRPAETKDKFICSPGWMPTHLMNPQSRFYRTGDLAKCLKDGTVVYVGRIDNQVKIRGQRLELEEVEKNAHDCLVSIQDVESKRIVVEAIASSNLISKQLVAFVQSTGSFGFLDWETPECLPAICTSSFTQQQFAAAVHKIESAMKQVLPVYAIPSIWIPVRTLPLSASRKVDRKRVRDIIAPLSVKQLVSFVTPTSNSARKERRVALTETEAKLLGAWAAAFDINPLVITPEDNFFTLGGDSLMAIKLVTAARAKNIDLSFEKIFKYPVLRQMALATGTLNPNDHNQTTIPPFSLLDAPRDAQRVRREAASRFSVSESRIQDVYPCSPIQEGLLALSMKDASAYILQFVYSLPDSVDIEKLRAAWEEVAASTAVLKTRFFIHNSDLLQVVINEPLRWGMIDAADIASALAAVNEKDKTSEEALSQFTVVRLQNHPHRHLIWTVHHALVDRWSESLIASSVEQAYLKQPATERPPGFNTFIRHIKQQSKEASKAFWEWNLTDAPSSSFPRLPHPTYIPKVQKSHQVVHRVSFQETSSSTKCLHPSSLKRGSITTATIIQAAWSLILSIYSNSSDVVTGLTLNGRSLSLPGIEAIPGPTFTTVPFRTRISPDKCILDFLSDIQNNYVDILPFSQFGLQNIRQLSDDANAACGFRSLLLIQTSTRARDSPNVLKRNEFAFPHMEFGIVMECELLDGGIDLRASFDPKLLSLQEVQQVCRQMNDILQRLYLRESSTTVSELQKITSNDRVQILQWNNMGVYPPVSTSCIHKLFSKRAQQQGSSQAICAWDGQLTYNSLDLYSSNLAKHLRMQYGVGPESTVIVYFDKSLWAVVSMLAVLKVGGCFVPVNPADPAGRIKTVIAKLGKPYSNVILTSLCYTERLKQLGLKALTVDGHTIDAVPKSDFMSNDVAPSNAAFIVFTSGSTGTPKGIVVEHKAFCSGALAWGPLLKRNEQSRVLQFASYSFDVSLGDIFSTLIFGGCVCIPSEYDRMNNLKGAIQSLGANQLSLTPTVASYLRPEELPNVTVLAVAGEVMTKEVVKIWANHVNLVNIYGPAECAVYSAGKAGFQSQEDPSNIGWAAGCLSWIVNPEDPDSLTPIGGIGELLIEGPNLARGYLGDDAQTRAAFIEDPIWSRKNGQRKGRRFYRTGDLARYGADGSLLFIGRNDGQVKLHGQRLEVTEVEHQLRQNIPDSVKVAVTVISSEDGEQLLAAFLALQSDKAGCPNTALADSAENLKYFQSFIESADSRLRSILPRYMIPSVYIPVNSLPLSASAKIDRKALHNLSSKHSMAYLSSLRGDKASTKTSIPPSTRMEWRIHDLWRALFNVEHISVDDSFFALGGSSILAMRLVSMARKEGITMTVYDIFHCTTLRDLALTVQDSASNVELPPFSLLQGVGIEELRCQTVKQCRINDLDDIEDIYPCTRMQLHYVTGYPEANKDPSGPWDWQSQAIFTLSPSMDLSKLKAVWNAAIRRHPTLRSRLIRTDSGIFQAVIKEDGQEMWHESHNLQNYLRSDRSTPMRFGDRLVRLALITTSPDTTPERYFVLSAHHSIYDGFSRSMLFSELRIAYTNGVNVDGPLPKMTQFVKYITQTADKPAATAFWTSYLSTAKTKALLTIRGNPPPHDLRQTDQKLTQPLPRLPPSEITLPTILEVASGLAIATHLDTEDVIFYSDRSGRNHPVEGIQDLIGPTTLFLPIRIHLDKAQTVHDLLHSSQRFQAAMIPYEHVGWLELREMEHLKPILRHSLNMNVKPQNVVSLDWGQDLQFQSSYASCDDPFGIEVTLLEGEIEWKIYYDERFITSDTVAKLLSDLTRVFKEVVTASARGRSELTVGEMMGCLLKK